MPRITQKGKKTIEKVFGQGVSLEKDPNRTSGNRLVRRMPKKGKAECRAPRKRKRDILKKLVGAYHGPDVAFNNQPWMHDPLLAHMRGSLVGGANQDTGNAKQGNSPAGPVAAGRGRGFSHLNNNAGGAGRGGFPNPHITDNRGSDHQNFDPMANMPNPHMNQANRSSHGGFGPGSPTQLSNAGPHAHHSELSRANALGGQTNIGQPPRGFENQRLGGDGFGMQAGQTRFTQNASTVARSRREVPGPGTIMSIPDTQELQQHEEMMPSQHTRMSKASTAVGHRPDQEFSVHPLIPTATNAHQFDNGQSRHTRASAASTAVGQRQDREYSVHNPMDNLAHAMGQLSTIQEASENSHSRVQSDSRRSHQLPNAATMQRQSVHGASQAPTFVSQYGAQASPSELARVDEMHGGTQMGYPPRGYADQISGTGRSRQTRGSRRSRR